MRSSNAVSGSDNQSREQGFANAARIHNETQYPPQTGAYKVSVKTGDSWRYSRHARLQVSVGQPAHEADKFAATMGWVANRFTPAKGSKIHICINDGLQRWNYVFAEGLSMSEATVKANKLGSEWMKRNASVYEDVTNVALTRWDFWRSNDNFDEAMNKTRALYGSNREFKSAIDDEIDAFWKRQLAKDDFPFDASAYVDFSNVAREYLLEETAVFSLMFKENPAQDIYPGTSLLPCLLFQDQHVPEAPDGLGEGRFTRIDFNRNSMRNGMPGISSSGPNGVRTTVSADSVIGRSDDFAVANEGHRVGNGGSRSNNRVTVLETIRSGVRRLCLPSEGASPRAFHIAG